MNNWKSALVIRLIVGADEDLRHKMNILQTYCRDGNLIMTTTSRC